MERERTTSPEFAHEPVLPGEVLAALAVRPGGRYLDATVGGAGHTFAIATAAPGGRILALDRDPEAVAAASARLVGFDAVVVHAEFSQAVPTARAHGFDQFDGILADLGVSSHQLDAAPRGFSFQADGPLDMRMDPSCGENAAELLARLDEESLGRLIADLSDERYARRIAQAIKRRSKPLATTCELANLVDEVVPRAGRGRIHPATRTFQALRMAVNDELGALARFLDAAPGLLAPAGRLCVIAFHSLEDRRVKERFVALEGRCSCPPGLPVCGCGQRGEFRMVRRGAVQASAAECARNPRARSARLRTLERLLSREARDAGQ